MKHSAVPTQRWIAGKTWRPKDEAAAPDAVPTVCQWSRSLYGVLSLLRTHCEEQRVSRSQSCVCSFFLCMLCLLVFHRSSCRSRVSPSITIRRGSVLSAVSSSAPELTDRRRCCPMEPSVNSSCLPADAPCKPCRSTAALPFALFR